MVSAFVFTKYIFMLSWIAVVKNPLQLVGLGEMMVCNKVTGNCFQLPAPMLI